MDVQVLHDLGLGKNEVEVFLKLLEMGPSTAVEISKNTSLHRPNVYDTLTKLIKRGLVSESLKENTKYFEVDDPDMLMNLLKEKELQLMKMIPEMKVKQFTAKPKSIVATYGGVVGTRQMLDDVLASGTKEILILGVPKEYAVAVGEGWLHDWHMERVKRKIMFRHLVNFDYAAHRIKLLQGMKFTTLKFLPQGYGTPNATYIYDHGVVMIFLKPLLAIRILNEDVVAGFKRYYDLLDKIASDKHEAVL